PGSAIGKRLAAELASAPPGRAWAVVAALFRGAAQEWATDWGTAAAVGGAASPSRRSIGWQGLERPAVANLPAQEHCPVRKLRRRRRKAGSRQRHRTHVS